MKKLILFLFIIHILIFPEIVKITKVSKSKIYITGELLAKKYSDIKKQIYYLYQPIFLKKDKVSFKKYSCIIIKQNKVRIGGKFLNKNILINTKNFITDKNLFKISYYINYNYRINKIKAYLLDKIKTIKTNLFYYYMLLGDIEFKKQNYNSALKYYKKSLKLYPKLNLPQIDTIIKIGQIYYFKKKYKLSKIWLDKAIPEIKYYRKYKFVKKYLYTKKSYQKKQVKEKYNDKSKKEKLPSGFRDKIVFTARKFLNKRWSPNQYYYGRKFNFDCSGFVRKVFWTYKIELINKKYNYSSKNGVKLIYYSFKNKHKIYKRKIPKKGDLVFFNNTFDANKNGLVDDYLIHIGIVDKILKNGTFSFLHRTSKGIKRDYMNLYYPKIYKRKGHIYNSFIRRKRRSDKKNTPHMAGETFCCFGNIR